MKRYLTILLSLILGYLVMRGLAVWLGLFTEFSLGSWALPVILILVGLLVVYALFKLRGTRLRVLLFFISLLGGFYLSLLLARLMGIDGSPHSDDEGSVDSPTLLTGAHDNLYEDVEPLRTGDGCRLPRGGRIRDGDQIFAYDTRTDDVCDAQLRICDDGTLFGSYTLPSCPEGSDADIAHREGFVYENRPEPVDPLIQPDSEDTQEYWYDIHGKRIDPNNPPTIEVTGIVVEPPEPVWNINIQPIYDCQTPRGERVSNGHFVKAYRYWEGYGDRHCEVQLRLCRNGELLGQFTYPECAYRMSEQG